MSKKTYESPETVTRQIVAGKRGNRVDPSLTNAVRFILQQQDKKITTADMSIVDGDEHDMNQVMRRIHGAIVQENLVEAKDTDDDIKDTSDRLSGSKNALANQIAQALNRYSSMDNSDEKGMLLLISALMLLNVSDDRDNINSTVRRLLTAGLSQMRKK